MRILRIRRGFTTNSSSAAEFLPDGGRIVGPSETPPPSGASSLAPSGASSLAPSGVPGPGTARHTHTPAPVLSSLAPWGSVAAPSSEPTSSVTSIGTLALVVVAVLLVGPVIRMVRRRRNRQRTEPCAQDDAPPPS